MDKEALAKKQKYLRENPHYGRQEGLFHRRTSGRYIGDLVYGANDGVITTFAIIAGSAGASLSPTVVIILGLANLLADGISMGASNFLGRKSERDFARSQHEREDWEIDNLPELEVEEIRDIFRRKGFEGENLEQAVKTVTSNKRVWLETMMKDELGILENTGDDPQKHALATFSAFVLAGFFPLLPYFLSLPERFSFSAVIGALTLFTVGALRSFITTVGWLRGGLEMLLIGSTAAAVAYLIGTIVEKFAR